MPTLMLRTDMLYLMENSFSLLFGHLEDQQILSLVKKSKLN